MKLIKYLVLSVLCILSTTLYSAPNDWIAYVTLFVGGNITPIHVPTNGTLSPIPFPGSTPAAIAITPDRKTAYITDSIGGGVYPLDLATNTFGPVISVGLQPFGIAITPDGKAAYVTNYTSHDVTPINLLTNTTGASIPVGTNPFSIAITPDGTKAYVTNSTDLSITPINLMTNTPEPLILLPQGPLGIAMAPDGKTVYANLVTSVIPIDVATNTLKTPISVIGAGPGIAITPDGKKAFVGADIFNLVTPIDLVNQVAGVPIPVGDNPQYIAITPDGKTAYVANLGSNFVTPINVATNTAGALIITDVGPFGIAVTPDQAPTARFSFTPNQGSFAVQFDASASTTPTGTIVSYSWNFGDGQTLVTTSPVIQHIYTRSGSFTVTLTVTNSAGTSTTIFFTGQTVSLNGGPSAFTSQNITISPLPPPPIQLPQPPTNLRGRQITNKFATQSDRINVITWNAPLGGPAPIKYIIYNDSALKHRLATMSAEQTLKFEAHHRKKNKVYAYFIVSEDASGRRSNPAEVVIE
jgi:YVTN family beta-propeller protein